MAITLREVGTATITATSGVGGPGNPPYLDVTGSFTATCFIYTGMITAAKDVEGQIGFTYASVNATTGRFTADRQLPDGQEIVFSWVSITAA